MYHSIDHSGPDALAPYRLSPDAFAQQIAYLRSRDYQTISLDKWAAAIRMARPILGRPVIITFDDGYRNFLWNAWPILQEAGYSATMFVVTGRVGGYADWETFDGPKLPLMNWDELRELRRHGLEIGSHTSSHRDLTRLNSSEIEAEIRLARESLRGELDVNVTSVAPPWGRTDHRVRRVLAESGCLAAVRTWGGPSSLEDDVLDLPRIEISPEDDALAFASKICEPKSRGAAIVTSQLDYPSPQEGNDTTCTSPAGMRSGAADTRDVSARQIAARLDALMGAFIRLSDDLLGARENALSLQQKIIKVFRQPITDGTAIDVQPYQSLASGLAVGFQKDAKVELCVSPKTDFTQSPESCCCTLDFSIKGPSAWLSLEVAADWGDISSATRYQLGIYAIPSCPLHGRGLLRLPTKSHGFKDIAFASFNLEGDRSAMNMSGSVPVIDYAGIDLTRSPTFIIDLNTSGLSHLALRINYLSIYFD